MTNVFNLPLPEGNRIILFVDLVLGELSIDWISGQCCRIGLKISVTKFKDMALRLDVQDSRLRIQGLDLEVFQYLGIYVDQQLTCQSHRHMILRSFYGHAIHPVVDYASVAQI